MKIDTKLIEACLQGERRAQQKLYEHCYPLLMSICMRYSGQKSEAVDILNTGFLKILEGMDSRGNNIPFEAWACRVMINTAIDAYRREKRYRDHVVFPDSLPEQNQDTSLDWNEAEERLAAEEIEAMIQALPPVTRQVFNLYAIDGYRHPEIAKMLEISAGTSRWHVSSARSQIREMLKKRLEVEKSTQL